MRVEREFATMRVSLASRIGIGLALALLVVASSPRARAMVPSDELFVQPGRLIDVGGFRLNLRCAGHGTPTVVFDAGLGDWSAAWSTVQPSIASRTRTCSYDRAGNGLSDAGPFPRTSSRIATELQTLLLRAGERPPYVLVGHSFGSLNMRLFADRHLDEVAGIVLVDGSHEDQGKLLGNDGLPEYAHQLATCERLAQRGFPLRTSRADCVGLFFRELPEPLFSRRLNAALVAQALAPKQYAATRSELLCFGTLSADEVRAAKRSYGSIPLRILTATNHRSAALKKSAAFWRHWEATWHALHDTWLPLSTDSKEIMARGSGHYIQFDRPRLVITTIDDVVARVRAEHPS